MLWKAAFHRVGQATQLDRIRALLETFSTAAELRAHYKSERYVHLGRIRPPRRLGKCGWVVRAPLDLKFSRGSLRYNMKRKLNGLKLITQDSGMQMAPSFQSRHP